MTRLAAVALVCVLAGCGGADSRQAPPKRLATVIASPTATATPAVTPVAVPAAARTRAAALPVDELAGQVFVVGFDGTDLQADVFEQLRGHGWGGIVIDAANAPDGPSQMAGEAAVVARDAKRPVPFVMTAPTPQQPIGRTATAHAAAQLRATGVTLVLQPVADVGVDGGDPALPVDPAVVARRTRAAVSGWLGGGVVPAPGHFPGQGAASQAPIDGPSQVGLSLADLRGRDLLPFQRLRAPVVVVSSSTFTALDPVTPAALVPQTYALLRATGFGGVAMTDDLATLGGPAAAVDALRAGADLILVSDPRMRDAAYDAVLAAVQSGALSAARVSDAAAHVLALKAGVGLL